MEEFLSEHGNIIVSAMISLGLLHTFLVVVELLEKMNVILIETIIGSTV